MPALGVSLRGRALSQQVPNTRFTFQHHEMNIETPKKYRALACFVIRVVLTAVIP